MKLRTEIESLRLRLERLAREGESDIAAAYPRRFPPAAPPGLYRRLRMALGRLLRRLGLRRDPPPRPWLPGLKHFEGAGDGKALLIWALDTDREQTRRACLGIERLQASLPGWTPVLVTDIADFAFFSRLGWLVEYVPSFGEPAGAYRDRKTRYLAWRYREAPSLPVSVGLLEHPEKEDLLLD